MIRILAAFAVAQLLDLVTYLRAPHLEANPFVADVEPARVAAAKLAAIVVAGAMVVAARRWRRRTAHQLLEAALLFGIGLGAFGAGTNVATLSLVAAAEAPRSVQEPAPSPEGRGGIEQGAVSASVTLGRTAAPSTSVAGSPLSPAPVSLGGARADGATTAVPPAADRWRARAMPELSGPPSAAVRLEGPASWYCLPGRSACTRGFAAGGAFAAAGPRIRSALGPDWRGRVVLVDGIRVRLIDWCACPGGRLLDLYGSVFGQLAPLSRGVIHVEVAW